MNSFLNGLIVITVYLNLMSHSVYGMLAGGRPNSISGGANAFAGVVNPANAVWIEDRFDAGLFIVHQKLILNNQDNNPLLPSGKINQTYKTEYLHTGDAAIHKRFKVQNHECSISLAAYTTPGYTKFRTKRVIPLTGKTPVFTKDKSQVISTIFSLKINQNHSIGFSLDYFYLSHLRNGYQNADNRLRSVSPGHVTNNGIDHSSGLGLSLGWIWNINKSLTFGLAFIKKSYVGQFRKYRGYEVRHAHNYIPESIGAGFTYRFNKKLAGRMEVLWTDYGNLPASNNSILPNGKLNPFKRGSNYASGSGLQDATFINLGIGYQLNSMLSLGAGLSHRIKLPRKSPYIISHSYMRQAVYDLITFGANFKYRHNEIFLIMSHGMRNDQTGYFPKQLGGGKFSSKKRYDTLSLAWGYIF